MAETVILFGLPFRGKIEVAIEKFERAFEELVSEGTPQERQNLRNAADELLRILASILLRME